MGKTDIKSNESFQVQLSAVEKFQMLEEHVTENLTLLIGKDGDQGGLLGGSDI